MSNWMDVTLGLWIAAFWITLGFPSEFILIFASLILIIGIIRSHRYIKHYTRRARDE